MSSNVPSSAAPRAEGSNPIPADAQAVFDTVTGPNLRASDNLIQLAVIVAGTLMCALLGAGWAVLAEEPAIAGLMMGGFIGAVVSLLLSGAVLGVIRLATTVKRR